MKRYIICALFLCGILSLDSCIERQKQASPPKTEQVANKPPQQKTTKDGLEQSRIAICIALSSFALSMLAFLFTIWRINKVTSREHYKDTPIYQSLREKIRSLENQINEQSRELQGLKNNLQQHYKAIEANTTHLVRLTQKLSQIQPQESVVPPPSRKSHSEDSQKKHKQNSQSRIVIREGYLGINKENFFNDFYENPDDKAYFRVSIFDNNEGEFELVDLQRIKSADSIGLAVETDGCRIEEARTYETKQKGKIKKGDGDLWIIDSPLKLTLNK